jgi:hypothetical protein
VQDHTGPVSASTPSETLDEACESDYASLMSSPTPFGSSAITSYIEKLLETAFTDGYDQYGIPGSPTGSLVSMDDANEATSEFAMSSLKKDSTR